jgi:hypothetical protein
MNNIKTFEGFFDFFKSKNKDVKSDDDKNKKDSSKSGLNPFSKKDDDLASLIYLSIKNSLELNDGKVLGIHKYQDYKRLVQYKGKDSKLYNVAVQKTSGGDNYILVINNKHYLDTKTNKSTVSLGTLKKLWNLLDSNLPSDKEDIKTGF